MISFSLPGTTSSNRSPGRITAPSVWTCISTTTPSAGLIKAVRRCTSSAAPRRSCRSSRFGLHLAQFGTSLTCSVRNSKDTDFRFGDVLLGAGNRCKVLAQLALNLCPPALQCEQTRFRSALVEQRLQIGQLALDQAQLFVCRADLRFEPNDLFVELGDALSEIWRCP